MHGRLATRRKTFTIMDLARVFHNFSTGIQHCLLKITRDGHLLTALLPKRALTPLVILHSFASPAFTSRIYRAGYRELIVVSSWGRAL